MKKDTTNIMQKINSSTLTKMCSILISVLYDLSLINYKELKVKWHFIRELLDRFRGLVRLCTILYPELSFKSLEHNKNEGRKKVYNDDFVVGFYTVKGPVGFYFKKEYLKEFNHLPFCETAPLISTKENILHKARIQKIRTFRQMIGNGVPEKLILEEINNSLYLDESQKPKNKKLINIGKEQLDKICTKNIKTETLKEDLTQQLSDILNALIERNVIDSKDLCLVWHPSQDYFDLICELMALFTASCPQLSFISRKHYDEEKDSISSFNDDFITGLYTPDGPVSFHFKNKEANNFNHLDWIESSPKYDNYDHDEFMNRLNSLAIALTKEKNIEEITELINNNKYLHESQKPSYQFINKKAR